MCVQDAVAVPLVGCPQKSGFSYSRMCSLCVQAAVAVPLVAQELVEAPVAGEFDFFRKIVSSIKIFLFHKYSKSAANTYCSSLLSELWKKICQSTDLFFNITTAVVKIAPYLLPGQ